ncbi:hypothetical protein Q5752_003829 [Cryptotrichosporon argae]
MEKFSKWRDPATGIQPFLPLAPASSPVALAYLPFGSVLAALRLVFLLVTLMLHLVLVEAVARLIPLRSARANYHAIGTKASARFALLTLGYVWISDELVSAKRGAKGVAQLVRPPRRGDLVVFNWTSYVDVLLLLYKYDPVFLLPVFTPPATSAAYGRSTGTGSASIRPASSSSVFLGYLPISPLSLARRTGALPPTYPALPPSGFATLSAAHRAADRPLALLAEGTTSNGRAVLKFADGVLADPPSAGIVWLTHVRHPGPGPLASPAPCPVPSPAHALAFLTAPTRTVQLRTLHPSAAPSSPSFLPSEVVSAAGLGRVDERGVWREAIAIVLAETGRSRRVTGMGWAEKAEFLDYYYKRR